MFSTPETSVHVQDKNREISPLEREEGCGGKDLEKRWVLRREWKTMWDTPTTDLGAESKPSDGGEHCEVADWQGTRRDVGSLFHRWGAAYRKERLVILRLDWACGYPLSQWRTPTDSGSNILWTRRGSRVFGQNPLTDADSKFHDPHITRATRPYVRILVKWVSKKVILLNI